jgi:outer membrane receptor protein involved in Fe transport
MTVGMMLRCSAGSAMIVFAFSAVQVLAAETNSSAQSNVLVSRWSESEAPLDAFSIASLRQPKAMGLKVTDAISLQAGSSQHQSSVAAACAVAGPRNDANCHSSLGAPSTVWSYASLGIRLDEDLAIYARTGRAYRIGGHQLRNVGIIGSVDTSISDRPEVRFEHEAGITGQLLDRKVMLNLSAYYNKVQSSQTTLTLTTPSGVRFSSFINPTTLRNMGFEFDLTIKPAKGFAFYSSLASNREKFKLCAGGFCPGHARDIMQTQVNVGANFQRGIAIGELALNVNCNWTGRGAAGASFASRLPRGLNGRSATTVDARASLDLANSPIELFAYGRNLTDHRFMPHRNTLYDISTLSLLNTPRTFGAGIAIAF